MDFSLVEKYVNEYYDEIVKFRRDLHMYPELSGQELETSKKVAKKLKNLPVDIKENIGGHGIIALLKGQTDGKTILLRGDMDALPIKEVSDVPYCSKTPNVMHACGHDMHTAMLLGTAMVLSKFKNELNGNVKFMFQPAEEVAPKGGSQGMIADGILENPKVDEAYGMHVYGVPTGSVLYRPGVLNARSDRITITINGKSAHGSLPSEGRDAILAAGNIITSIQSIISRNLGPGETAVITIGTVSGGDKYNVIADKVILEGTVRTFSKTSVDVIKERLSTIVNDIASAYGCIGELNYVDGYDFIYNDPTLTEYATKSIGELLGPDKIIHQDNPLPAGEDFSFISKKVPSFFLWIGTESEFNKGNVVLHNPKFMVDEETIKYGIKIMCKLVFDSFARN
ncbi:amidohydrolase [Fusobacterium sp. PH5-44]|uniref:amidohydrolase n=1 Tax=unclassified Fusobacterium TaxID=2648384 RepID=UPI003D1FE476